jgi:pimeloyl-ACP methyl ester carboxylesterase
MQIPHWFTDNIAAPTTTHSIEVAQAQISYRTWNADANKPGLLFVHGYGAHSHWWDFIAPAFIADYRVAALDLSGAGDSEHRDHYTARTFAAEILAVAKALEDKTLGDQTIVVGHSFGGGMTRIAGFEHGAELGAVVLVDSALPRHQGPREAPPAPRAHTRVYPSLEQGMRRFRLRPPQPCSNQFILAHIARHSLRACAEGYQFKLDQALFAKLGADPAPALPAAAEMVSRIDCPVGVIYGALSRFFDADTQALLSQLLPAKRVLVVADAHHHVFLDQPLAFIAALKQLLPRLFPTTNT